MNYYEDIQTQCDQNRAQALKAFKTEYDLSAHTLNNLRFLTEKYTIRYILGIGDNKHSDIVLSTMYKSLNNMQAIMNLTISGNVGAARIVMRNVFEYLVMGKYFQLVSDEEAAEKWVNTEYINIDRRVFQRTIYPDNRNKEAFLRWWGLLCQYSHATRVSGQVSFLFEEIKQEILVNFSFTFMLLSMLHHFMSNFLANDYFRNYADSLKDQEKENAPQQSLNQCTRELKTLIKAIKSTLTKECRQILSYYVAAWRIVPVLSKREPLQKTPGINRMQEVSHLPSVSSTPTSKAALLKYLSSFVRLYAEPQEGLTEGYRKSVLKYLKRMQALVTEYTFFGLPDESYFYALDILNDRIRLSLGIRDWSASEDIEDDSVTWTQSMVLLEVKSEYLNADQYATLHGVSRNTVAQWIRRVLLHGAQKIGGYWLIPELQPRPEHGTYHVQYTWSSLPSPLIKKYPMLKDSTGIFISKQRGVADYTFQVDSHRPRKLSILDDTQRVRLEMDLMEHDELNVNDVLVTLVPR